MVENKGIPANFCKNKWRALVDSLRTDPEMRTLIISFFDNDKIIGDPEIRT